jgi:hypothetical protein
MHHSRGKSSQQTKVGKNTGDLVHLYIFHEHTVHTRQTSPIHDDTMHLDTVARCFMTAEHNAPMTTKL